MYMGGQTLPIYTKPGWQWLFAPQTTRYPTMFPFPKALHRSDIGVK